MKLFELDDTYNVIFNPEVFLLKDFQVLRDSRKDINILSKEMAFIYFYCDLRSDFQFQTSPEERKKEIKKFVKLDDKWEPDDKLKTCMEVYKYLSQTVSSGILESAYLIADKIKTQLKDIDLAERHAVSGVPIWDLKKILDTSKALPELMESIRKAESEYLKGQTENEKLRGDKIKTLYEDGFERIKQGKDHG